MPELDLAIILAPDTLANRPAVGAVSKGALFNATDTGQWFRNNRSAWVDITPFAIANYSEHAEVSAPATPASGKVRLYTKTDHLLYYKDSTGAEHAVGSSSYADPLTTNGDLIVRSGGVTTRLAIGASGKFIHSDGSVPSWQNIVNADLPTSGIGAGTYKSLTSNVQGINTAGTLLTGVVAETLATQNDQTSLGAVTSDTTLLGHTTGSLTAAANALVVGRTYLMMAAGYFSTSGTAPTLDLKIKLGGTTLMNTGTAFTVSRNLTNFGWRLQAMITCQATGLSGKVWGQGDATMFNNQGWATAAPLAAQMVTTALVTLDTTISNAFDLTAAFGAATAGNAIALTNFILVQLN